MIVIGKIKENNGLTYPPIRDVINKPIENKNKVLDYMNSGKVLYASTRTMTDVVTGETVDRELVSMTDGKYGWRSDTVYYFEKYDMELPSDFVDYVLKS